MSSIGLERFRYPGVEDIPVFSHVRFLKISVGSVSSPPLDEEESGSCNDDRAQDGGDDDDRKLPLIGCFMRLFAGVCVGVVGAEVGCCG